MMIYKLLKLKMVNLVVPMVILKKNKGVNNLL